MGCLILSSMAYSLTCWCFSDPQWLHAASFCKHFLISRDLSMLASFQQGSLDFLHVAWGSKSIKAAASRPFRHLGSEELPWNSLHIPQAKAVPRLAQIPWGGGMDSTSHGNGLTQGGGRLRTAIIGHFLAHHISCVPRSCSNIQKHGFQWLQRFLQNTYTLFCLTKPLIVILGCINRLIVSSKAS